MGTRMRQKKDPGIRQEVFVQTALGLFAERGYENVAVRDVLEAVGERSASPSVFYYYFPSKVALYDACVRAASAAYLSQLRVAFDSTAGGFEDQLVGLAVVMEQSLAQQGSLIAGHAPAASRGFVLDIRTQVTEGIADMWAGLLQTSGICPDVDVDATARFLAGGVGELVFCHLASADMGQEATAHTMDAMVHLVLTTLGLPAEQRERLLQAWQSHRREARAEGTA